MRGFLAGLAVGAALGAAVTAALTVGAARPGPPVVATSPATTPRPTRVRGKIWPTDPADAAPVSGEPASPGASPPATARLAAIDVDKAPLDDLLLEIEARGKSGVRGRKDPPTHDIVRAIRTRFPEHVFSVASFRSIVTNPDGEAVRFAMETWTDEFALGEFQRLSGSRDPPDRRVLRWMGDLLGGRKVSLPGEICAGLLRREGAEDRKIGIRFSAFTPQPDVVRILEIAKSDPSNEVRARAIDIVPWLVAHKMASPEQFRDAVLDAARTGNGELRNAGFDALASIGPEGARFAIDSLARDGAGLKGTDSLVAAAVDGGRAADVLALRLGRSVSAMTARALAERSGDEPDLLRDAKGAVPELVAALAESDDDESLQQFLRAVTRTIGPLAAREKALDRTAPARAAAIRALCGVETSWQEGRDLARRIAADPTENSSARVIALEVMDSEMPEERAEELGAENRAFITELLRDETNARVRERLKELAGD